MALKTPEQYRASLNDGREIEVTKAIGEVKRALATGKLD